MSHSVSIRGRRSFLSTALALLAAPAVTLAAAAKPQVQVWKTPTCGCCQAWVEHMQREGFTVKTFDVEDTSPIRKNAGMPEALGSCHTAVVNRMVLEGHVPAREVRRLLAETVAFRNKVIGLSVPAMPVGSPGMEQGNRRDPYSVLLVFKDGTSRAYKSYS